MTVREEVRKFWVDLYHDHVGEGRAKALGWESAESMARRYSAIIRHLRVPDDLVVDFGCGTADLLWCMMSAIGHSPYRYIGIDLNEELVRQNKALFPSATFATEYDLSLTARDPGCGTDWEGVRRPRWFIQNGVFNQVYTKAEAIELTLWCIEQARVGFIGTYTSVYTRYEYKNGWTNYWHPSELVGPITEKFQRAHVVVDQSYLENDFLIKVEVHR